MKLVETLLCIQIHAYIHKWQSSTRKRMMRWSSLFSPHRCCKPISRACALNKFSLFVSPKVMQQIIHIHPTYLMNGCRLTSSLINLRNPIRCFFSSDSKCCPLKMDGKNVQPKAMTASAGYHFSTYSRYFTSSFMKEFLDPGLDGEVSSGVSSMVFLRKIL